MTFNLITEEEFQVLNGIYNNFPALTFQNEGYQGINREDLTEEEREKIKEIEVILEKSIIGFSKFQNFRNDKQGVPYIRLQYDYSADDDTNSAAPFTGVGYIKIDTLKDGLE